MPILTLEEKKKAESFGLGDFQFDEGELQGLRDEPLLITTETAADDVRKHRDIQTSLQGQTTTPAGDIKKETPETPEIPKEKLDNVATDGTTGTPISFEEALEIYGNDFTGLHRTEKGEYIPDETALARTGIKGLETAKIDKSEEEFETAKNELKAAQNRLTGFDVSNDPALIRMKESITAQWDARIEEMRDINTRREKSFETLGFRTGARFTGGARGGIFGGILSEEERQGTMRIADFEAKKQSALIAAENAFRTQKWSEYSDLVDIAEDNYTKQLTELEKLQKAQAKQSQKIQDEKKQIDNQIVINEVFNRGMTETADIQAFLFSQGINIPLKDIKDILDIINPPKEYTGLTADFKTFKQFFPDADTTTEKGQKQYLKWIEQVSSANRKPSGVSKDEDKVDEEIETSISPIALNVIDGIVDLNSLTPTSYEKTTAELRTYGYYDETPPEWYKAFLEEERQQNLLPEETQKEWDKHRKNVAGIKDEGNEKDEGNKEIEALVAEFPDKKEQIKEALANDYSIEEIRNFLKK